MRLIDADRLYNTIIDEIDPISISMDGGEMRGMMRTIIASEPTIEAVPLDRLCEWLADQIHASVDCGIDHCDNCDAYDGTLSVKGCWMKLIKEQVMEEHNGTDNP